MADAIFRDSFPDLKELENKVGRKTPDSLLDWMSAAADCEGAQRTDAVDRRERAPAAGDGISAKIVYLKREMQWLRSADVKILRQLVAVHEGIEAMRWLMEDHGALASWTNSLTGSLSSLVTVEEPGPRISPCSENQTCPQHLTETHNEESQDQQPPHTYNGDSEHKSYCNMLNPKSTGARPPSGKCAWVMTNPAKDVAGGSLQKSQPPGLDASPLKAIRSGANTIKRALLRANRVRNEVNVDTIFTKKSLEKHTEHQTQESFRASQNNTVEDDQSTANKLDYDAHWSQVESQDDVTYL